MSRRRRRAAPPEPQTTAPAEPQPAPYEGSALGEAARQYLSAGLGMRANLILGSIALMGLLIFVATSVAGPISGDEDGPPGPTVFPTR